MGTAAVAQSATAKRGGRRLNITLGRIRQKKTRNPPRNKEEEEATLRTIRPTFAGSSVDTNHNSLIKRAVLQHNTASRVVLYKIKEEMFVASREGIFNDTSGPDAWKTHAPETAAVVSVVLLSTQLKPFPRRECVRQCLNKEMLQAGTADKDPHPPKDYCAHKRNALQ